MNRACIFCKTPLNKGNRSNEHIIPQCMGGRLQSRDLICVDCNSKFGTEFDEALIKRFCIIMIWLRLYNDQIKIKDVEVELDDKKYLFTEKGLRLKSPRPILDENGELKGMTFPSEKSMRLHYEKKKRDPSIDIQARIDQSEKEIIYIQGAFTFRVKQIDEEAYHCCGKICYEFLHLINKDYIPSNDNFIDFVMGSLQIEEYPICPWYSEYDPFNKDEEKIYNLIVVEGRSADNIVLAYFEGYSCLKTIMIIDRNYYGDSFCKGYYIDLMENLSSYFDPLVKIPLNRSEIINLIDNCDLSSYHEKILKSSFHSGDKARIYPFKVTLRDIRKNLDSMEYSRTVENLTCILEVLTKVFQKYGIDGFVSAHLENVNELYEEDVLLEKVFIHLSYLMHYFQRAGVNFDIIGEVVENL